MIKDVKNNEGVLIGKASYIGDKLHGRCFRYFPNTLDIDEEHTYHNGIKHGECIRYNGCFRYVEYFEFGKLVSYKTILETETYLGITETSFKKLPQATFVGGYFKTYKEVKITTRMNKNV